MRGVIKNRIDISQRPAIADAKSEFGHIEGDTMTDKGRQGVLITLVDKHSKFTKLARISTKKAAEPSQAMIAALRFFADLNLLKTITVDNGKEFAQHETVAKELNATVYFARPYASYKRGLNEHTNGLARQYLPKSTSSIANASCARIQGIEDKLNNRPRKALNYRTPKEVLERTLAVALHT